MNEKYDRVTEVLSPFSGIQYVPENILIGAQERGTKVHAICESIIRGLGDWHDDESVKGYVESFKKWWSKDYKPVLIEHRFKCEKLKITGQVDFIYKDPELGTVLTDIKTSSREGRTWPLQGSAYKYLASQVGYKVDLILFLRLRKTGQYPFVHLYPDRFPMFLKCLDVYRFIYNRQNYDPEKDVA